MSCHFYSIPKWDVCIESWQPADIQRAWNISNVLDVMRCYEIIMKWFQCKLIFYDYFKTFVNKILDVVIVWGKNWESLELCVSMCEINECGVCRGKLWVIDKTRKALTYRSTLKKMWTKPWHEVARRSLWVLWVYHSLWPKDRQDAIFRSWDVVEFITLMCVAVSWYLASVFF